MKKFLPLIFPVLLLCQLHAIAQTITGRVSTQDNETLSGVSIKVSGTKQGVTTDAAGNYFITAGSNAALQFSYIGFLEQTIDVNGRSTINVVLVKNADSMQTIVVTALGIKKEVRTLGYATATVNNDQIATNRTPNVVSGLQGKMAGVNITTMGTGPAGTAKIRIRGQSSFSSRNDPLIVINGVPMDNTNYAIGGSTGPRAGQVNSTDGGDAFSSINPDDIESMTVLKGATASALYGSRAKDGVIMITTKNKGTTKGVGVEYNVNLTTDTPLDFTDFQYEYGQGERG